MPEPWGPRLGVEPVGGPGNVVVALTLLAVFVILAVVIAALSQNFSIGTGVAGAAVGGVSPGRQSRKLSRITIA